MKFFPTEDPKLFLAFFELEVSQKIGAYRSNLEGEAGQKFSDFLRQTEMIQGEADLIFDRKWQGP